MRQKGLAPIVVLLIIAVILVVGGLAYYFIYKSSPAPSTTPAVTTPVATNTGTVQTPSPLSATPYVDNANGFSIDLPQGWVSISNTSGQNEDDFAPSSSNPSEAIAIGIATTTPDRAKLMTIAKITPAALQKFQTYPGYNLILESTSTLQNLPAEDIIFSYTSSEGSVTIEIFYVINGDTLYSVTCSALSKVWNDDKSLLEQSLQTFKTL